MTIITLATVGFTEVNPLSDNGKVFTSVLIVLNLGIFTYSISNLTAFVLEGGIKEFIRSNKMGFSIEELERHVIVCGFGRIGRQVCLELTLEKKPFIVIEREPPAISALHDEFQYLYIQGDATDELVLEKAKIQRAIALITTLPKDADNVFVVLVARECNDKLNIISRSSQESTESKLKKAGCNHVILPERLSGTAMASIVASPDIVEFIRHITSPGNTEAYFEELYLEELAPHYQGKSIRELNIRQFTGANIIGVKTAEGHFVINPDAEFVLTPNSKLIMLGSREQISSLKRLVLNG